MNLTVKARVVLGFFTISVLLLIISGVSLINLRSLQHDVGDARETAPLQQIIRFIACFEGMQRCNTKGTG